MKKLYYLIVLALILGFALAGCTFLSNIGQAPATEQSGFAYLTKGVPLSVDLVGLWRFDGNAADSSGNDNHGTVYGEESYIISLMGQALSFDGVNNYVDCGNSASLRPINALTVEAWVNYAGFSLDSAGHAIVSEAQYTSNGFMLYQACGDPHNRVRYFVRTDTGLFIGQSGTQLLTDIWYHLAMTYDGSDLTLYIDGDYDSSVSATGPVKWSGTTPNLYIGSTYTAGGAKFKGFIDEVRIWNGALLEEDLGSIIYDFGGILPPIKEDGSRAFKLGSTIPVKFQLLDDNGEIVTNAEACIFVKKISNGTTGEIEAVSTAASTDGNLFRYDPGSEQYIFNLSTKLPLNGVSWSTGTWQIRIKLDDGTSKFVNIVLK